MRNATKKLAKLLWMGDILNLGHVEWSDEAEELTKNINPQWANFDLHNQPKEENPSLSDNRQSEKKILINKHI